MSVLPPGEIGRESACDPADNVRLINEEHAQVVACVQASADQMRAAISLAIRVGQRLEAQRRLVPSREWGLWLETCCPTISHPTAVRYMRLASKSHVIQSSPQLQTLRQAYLLAGIIKPAIPHGQFTPLQTSVPAAAVQVEMLSLYFTRWETTVLRKHLPDADRAQLEYWRDQLQPIVAAHQQITETLARL